MKWNTRNWYHFRHKCHNQFSLFIFSAEIFRFMFIVSRCQSQSQSHRTFYGDMHRLWVSFFAPSRCCLSFPQLAGNSPKMVEYLNVHYLMLVLFMIAVAVVSPCFRFVRSFVYYSWYMSQTDAKYLPWNYCYHNYFIMALCIMKWGECLWCACSTKIRSIQGFSVGEITYLQLDNILHIYNMDFCMVTMLAPLWFNIIIPIGPISVVCIVVTFNTNYKWLPLPWTSNIHNIQRMRLALIWNCLGFNY